MGVGVEVRRGVRLPSGHTKVTEILQGQTSILTTGPSVWTMDSSTGYSQESVLREERVSVLLLPSRGWVETVRWTGPVDV